MGQAAENLRKAKLTNFTELLGKLKLDHRQVGYLNLWIAWREEESFESGRMQGQREIGNTLRNILRIPDNEFTDTNY